MTSSSSKNQQERHRHRVHMAALAKEEKLWQVQSKRDIEGTRSELKSMMAYRKVYSDYSFYKNDEKDKKKKEKEQLNNAEAQRRGQRTPVRVSFNMDSVHHGGGVWNAGQRMPHTARPEIPVDARGPLKVRDGGQTERVTRNVRNNMNIATSRSMDERMLNKEQSLQHVQSSIRDLDITDRGQPTCSKVTTSDKADILVVNHKDVENDWNFKDEDEDEIKSRGRYGKYVVVEAKTFARPKLRNIAPQRNQLYGMDGQFLSAGYTPRKSVFPEQCRNTFALRRLMDDKAKKLIVSMSPESRRKREVKRILARVSFPQVVSRTQTTSAIFRDYRHMKERSGRKYSPSLRKKSSANKEVTFDISKVLKLPPMSREEKISLLEESRHPAMVDRSNTVV